MWPKRDVDAGAAIDDAALQLRIMPISQLWTAAVCCARGSTYILSGVRLGQLPSLAAPSWSPLDAKRCCRPKEVMELLMSATMRPFAACG